MQQVGKVVNDIFSMGFDIIIPLSGCIVAFVIALLLFLIRITTFKRNKRRYEKRRRAEEAVAAKAEPARVSAPAAPEPQPIAGDEPPPSILDESQPVVPDEPQPVVAALYIDPALAEMLESSIRRLMNGQPISAFKEMDKYFGSEMETARRGHLPPDDAPGQGSP